MKVMTWAEWSRFFARMMGVYSIFRRRLKFSVDLIGPPVVEHADAYYRDWLKAFMRREAYGRRVSVVNPPKVTALGNMRDLLERVPNHRNN